MVSGLVFLRVLFLCCVSGLLFSFFVAIIIVIVHFYLPVFPGERKKVWNEWGGGDDLGGVGRGEYIV